MRSIELNPDLAAEEQVDVLLLQVAKENQITGERGLEIRNSFVDFVDQASSWKKRAMSLVITDESQKAEMKLAREMRLALKNIRVEADKARKSLKEDSLRYSNAVQGAYNILVNIIQPAEEHLEKQEKYVELAAAKRRNELHSKRVAELTPFWEFVPTNTDFGGLEEEDYQKILKGAILQLELKKKAEAEEAERQRQLEIQAALDRSRRLECSELYRFMDKPREINFGALTEQEYKSLVRKAKLAKKVWENGQLEQQRARAAAEALAKQEREAREKAEAIVRKAREEAAAAARKAQEEAALKAKEEADRKAKEEAAAAALAAAPDIEKLKRVGEDINRFSMELLKKYEFATDEHRKTFEDSLRLLDKVCLFIDSRI